MKCAKNGDKHCMKTFRFFRTTGWKNGNEEMKIGANDVFIRWELETSVILHHFKEILEVIA